MEFPADMDIYGSNSIDASRDESQIESKFASIKQRSTNLETLMRSLMTRVDSTEQILGVACKNNPLLTNNSYPEEWSLRNEQDYVSFIKSRISQLRNNFEWRSCFSTFPMDGLTDSQKAKIDFILCKDTKSSISVSKIVNTIAVELIGVDNVKNYLIGVHGRSVKQGHDKRPPLPLDQENKLRSFFSFVDKIFITPNGWEFLVRKPVNQMGREFYSGKRKSNTQEPLAQAMFMHKYLNRQASLPGQNKRAITSNAVETNNDLADESGSPIMATDKEKRINRIYN